MDKLQILDNITAAVVDGDEHMAFENKREAIKMVLWDPW
jgi:hypothetical protein